MMTWRREGDNLISKPMLSLSVRVSVTRRYKSVVLVLEPEKKDETIRQLT